MRPHFPFVWTFHVAAVLMLSFEASTGLYGVSISSSPYVRYGEDAQLECEFHLDKNETLYAVKWYRGSQEFYGYLPKEVPPQRVFQLVRNFTLNEKTSNDQSVVLQNVQFEAAGKYTCLVSAEGTFKTLAATQNLTVVAIDRTGPTLHLDHESYHVGEFGRVSCSKNFTFPPVNVTWFVNGQEVNRTRPLLVLREEGKLWSVLSKLYFYIPDFLPLKLKCQTELYTVYNESSAIVIQPKPRLSSNYNLVNSNAKSAVRGRGNMTIPALPVSTINLSGGNASLRSIHELSALAMLFVFLHICTHLS